MAKHRAVIFDLDNTLANTAAIKEIRVSGQYERLTAEALAEIRPYGPVPDLLAALRAKGVPLGLLTNAGRGYCNKVLAHLGLHTFFDVVVTYSEVGSAGAKPNPGGILQVLQRLGTPPSSEVLYVGDEYIDVTAAYRAGVTPVMPSWGSKEPISIPPAIEITSINLAAYFDKPGIFTLFAERCAAAGGFNFTGPEYYFLPLNDSGDVVTMNDQMTTYCLGRYFSQKGITTARMHDHHQLSRDIAQKQEVDVFDAPPYWVNALAHVLQRGPQFMGMQKPYDVVTVIPSKQGEDPRMERLLSRIERVLQSKGITSRCVPDVFYFSAGALSQKTLGKKQRGAEVERSLHLTKPCAPGISILVIDDVITTGSTMARALRLLRNCGAAPAHGVAMAKTVSIFEDEQQCIRCGRPMAIRMNAKLRQRFLGCTGYKEAINPCSHTEELDGRECPSCGRPMRKQRNSFDGSLFWSCTGWNQIPKCTLSVDD